MKNKEKYEECVLTFACDEWGFGVYEKTGEMESCMKMQCTDCLFYVKEETCRTSRRKWLESEYVKKPVISKKDRAFLEYLREEFKFVARDEGGKLFAYKVQPKKENTYWKCTRGNCLLLNGKLNIDFPMVKWSDSEPWLIKELKKLEVVENYE